MMIGSPDLKKALLPSEKGPNSLLSAVDEARRDASRRLDPDRRSLLGQFLTPAPVAAFMAGMFDCRGRALRVLDPGAGVGSLSAAFVAEQCRRSQRPDKIILTAYELDPFFLDYLRETLDRCKATCEKIGIRFESRIEREDFLEAGASILSEDLFTSGTGERFDCVILNPPYRKIRTGSRERKLIRSIGVETSNLYTGFLAVAKQLLIPDGEMVAITPRSFCNGPYFEPFRRFFLRDMRFRRVHVFDTRDRAFADDAVLQENVIFHARKTRGKGVDVVVSSSRDVDDFGMIIRNVKHEDLVVPGDRNTFIHIVPSASGDAVRSRMAHLDSSLGDLGLTVSTGRVVDFRAKVLLRVRPGPDTVPLIYPCHLQRGLVEWPNGDTRKPNALEPSPGSANLLIPAGHYVLVKRFSAKEESRRIVAAVYDPARIKADRIAIENHLNYYHVRGCGLPPLLANGLALFLNSTLVDSYFRQFSGHTQVNASDLRAFRYPSRETLLALGRRLRDCFPVQEEVDRLVDEVVFQG
jgi:adenine-specific DNA-methyltransferase